GKESVPQGKESVPQGKESVPQGKENPVPQGKEIAPKSFSVYNFPKSPYILCICCCIYKQQQELFLRARGVWKTL
ncbi:MAG: hypothetical protein ACREDR_00570, partial [Blastocatellia bacterium]